MGGGDGGIIIRKSVINNLTDPAVHGRLPLHMQQVIDPILQKDEQDWTTMDKIVIAHVHGWALVNL